MLRIINQSETEKVICKECPRPFAVFKNGMALIQSTHGGHVHLNGVTAAELRKMADILDAKMLESPRVVV